VKLKEQRLTKELNYHITDLTESEMGEYMAATEKIIAKLDKKFDSVRRKACSSSGQNP